MVLPGFPDEATGSERLRNLPKVMGESSRDWVWHSKLGIQSLALVMLPVFIVLFLVGDGGS